MHGFAADECVVPACVFCKCIPPLEAPGPENGVSIAETPITCVDVLGIVPIEFP
jgi:hypothetical protein